MLRRAAISLAPSARAAGARRLARASLPATAIATARFSSFAGAHAQKSSKHFAALAAATVAISAAAVTVADASEAKPVDYEALKQDIVAIIEDDSSNGPLFVRLAWHASGTYDKKTKTGGSAGGSMRFAPESTDPANAGLHLGRNLLEPLRQKYDISHGDLWTLAGAVAIEEMGGPVIKWRPGRVNCENEPDRIPANGRLPDADKGSKEATAQHIRDVFYRMGFNDREIVALVGAHAVGRCHTDRSGYSGPWTRSEFTFSNEFFRELLENKWSYKNWNGPQQFEDPTGDLMMLPADMALIQDPEFKKYVEMYAKDEDLWHADFSKAFTKLCELGVDFGDKPWWKFW